MGWSKMAMESLNKTKTYLFTNLTNIILNSDPMRE